MMRFDKSLQRSMASTTATGSEHKSAIMELKGRVRRRREPSETFPMLAESLLVGDRYTSEWIRRNPRMVELFFEAILRGF